MRSHRDAVHKLHGAPQPVELHALVHVHHAVAGQWAAPDWVVQITADASQNDLEYGETAAQPLFRQQVTLTGDGNLLRRDWTGYWFKSDQYCSLESALKVTMVFI